jgi:hypothetical protein
VTGTVRYDDDPGNNPDEPWATIQAAHAGEVISGIYVSAGFSAGSNLSVLLTHLGVNGDDFCFNCPPPPVVVVGPAGPPGPGASTTTATPSTSASTAKQTCSGDGVRKLHAPKRPGQRFLSVRAALRGKALKVSGRTITADLTGRPEGNYNVRLKSRYRTHSGRISTVKTTRNLSVVCS